MVTGSGLTTTVVPSAASPAADTTPARKPESRRSNKPIMEKRRRARINNCLNELKTLILDAMKKDPARHSKLEKADILEMTVRHLGTMQRKQVAMDPQVLNKFHAGYSECVGEVGRFPGLESSVRRRLLQHLSTCMNSTSSAAEPSASPPAPASQESSPPSTQVSGVQLHILPTIESGNSIFFSTGSNNTPGLQLVPTRLPNGEFALVASTKTLGPVTTSTSPISPSSSTSPGSTIPLLLPMPIRTPSASSSSSSSMAFERLNVSTMSPPAHNSYHSPLSTSSSTASNDLFDQSMRSYSPVPLALVVNRPMDEDPEDEKPWRPW